MLLVCRSVCHLHGIHQRWVSRSSEADWKWWV